MMKKVSHMGANRGGEKVSQYIPVRVCKARDLLYNILSVKSSPSSLVKDLAAALTPEQVQALLDYREQLELTIDVIRALQALNDDTRDGQKQYWKLLESDKKSIPITLSSSLLVDKLKSVEGVIEPLTDKNAKKALTTGDASAIIEA